MPAAVAPKSSANVRLLGPRTSQKSETTNFCSAVNGSLAHAVVIDCWSSLHVVQQSPKIWRLIHQRGNANDCTVITAVLIECLVVSLRRLTH
jgi:hypothetical protein